MTQMQRRQHRLMASLAALAAAGLVLKRYKPETYYRFYNLVTSIASITYNGCLVVAGSLEISAILLRDFAQYLKSEEDELPQSLVRVFALLRSREFLSTYQNVISSGIDGFMQSNMGQKLFVDNQEKEGMVDKIITALLSEPGQNLVGLAVKMSTQTTVETFAYSVDLRSHVRQSSIIREILEWLNTPRAQQLVSHTTTAAVQTGVASFIESQGHTKSNPFEDLLSALSQPQHAEVARQLLQVLVREAITTTAIQIRNKQSAQGATSPRNSHHASPAREKRALSIPDIQQVNQPYGNSQIHYQISQGLAAIGSHQEARNFVVQMASQVTGSGIRAMIFSVLDILKGRGEFDNLQLSLDRKESSKVVQQLQVGLGSSVILTILMALLLHVSMYPVPLLQQQ